MNTQETSSALRNSQHGRHQSPGGKRSREGRKSSKSEKKRSKKEHKSKRRRHSISDSDSEADYRLDAQTAPVAAEYVRCILRKYPAMKSELRDLLWQIDNGKCPEINKVDDSDLLRGLRGLFGALNLRRSKDAYSLKAGQDKVLRRIGVVFNESIPDRSTERLQLPGDPVSQRTTLAGSLQGRSSPCERPAAADSPHERVHDSSPEPMLPVNQPDDAPTTRKVMFPAAAPQELLQAAAEAAAAMQAEGLLGDIVSGLSEQSIGPAPPPDVLKEMDSVSVDVRIAEAVRVNALVARARDHGIHSLTVVKEGDQLHMEHAYAPGPDAYEILDVPEAATAAEVRKKFWRMSLLVHPDKCHHEGAAAAFDAVKKAAEALMNAESRHEVDERRRNQAEGELDRQVAAELEKERQWRIAQGTATAEDLKGPLDAQQTRDEWMTALPDRKESKPAYMTQASVTTFSQQGGNGSATVDAGWTALPGQSPSEVRMLTSGSAAKPKTVQPKTIKDAIVEKNLELMALAQQQKQTDVPQEPTKTLLEKHQESIKEEHANRRRQRKEAKRKTEACVAEPAPNQPDWVGANAWRPFDREKDLQGPGRSSGPGHRPDQSLASRFRPASS